MRLEEPGVICKMDLEKAYNHGRFSTVHAEKVRVWWEVVLMDSSLYFLSAFLNFGERLSYKLL